MGGRRSWTGGRRGPEVGEVGWGVRPRAAAKKLFSFLINPEVTFIVAEALDPSKRQQADLTYRSLQLSSTT